MTPVRQGVLGAPPYSPIAGFRGYSRHWLCNPRFSMISGALAKNIAKREGGGFSYPDREIQIIMKIF